MSPLIILDAGPMGLVMNPKESKMSLACKAWLWQHPASGVRVVIPEVADYEVRRELLRAGRRKGLARLDSLADEIGYLPLDTSAMRLAAGLWAEARNRGWPTADDKALDADVILAAQAIMAERVGFSVVVATTKPGHLSRFVRDTRLWSTISRPLRHPGGPF